MKETLTLPSDVDKGNITIDDIKEVIAVSFEKTGEFPDELTVPVRVFMDLARDGSLVHISSGYFFLGTRILPGNI